MSAVIKSAEAAIDTGVRGLSVAPPTPVQSAEARLITELERRLETVQAELIARDRDIARLSAAVDSARSEGRAQGLVEGRKSAEDRSEALIRTVTDSAAEGVAILRDRLAGLEDAVGGLAALALGRIVGQQADRQALVVDTVRRAMGELFAGSVLTVEVSRDDFSDAATLQAVLPPECEVRLLDGLPSGGCRLRLRMGEVDLGLQGQAARLRAILDPAGGVAG